MKYGLVLLAACGAGPQLVDTVDTTPRLLGPGWISTADDDAHATLSPDGDTLYFLRDTPSFDLYTILYTRRDGRPLAQPAVAPFSGQFPDGDFAFAPDGKHAYFVSSRPVDGVARTDTEIWTVDILGPEQWSAPRHVAELGSPADEWFPTFAADGTLYFGSCREGGLGGCDIYRSHRKADGTFTPPENVGAPINSPANEIEPLISPDQTLPGPLDRRPPRQPRQLRSLPRAARRRDLARAGPPARTDQLQGLGLRPATQPRRTLVLLHEQPRVRQRAARHTARLRSRSSADSTRPAMASATSTSSTPASEGRALRYVAWYAARRYSSRMGGRRIAIIGSGQAGLVAAHGLVRAGHEVTCTRIVRRIAWLNDSRPTGTAARFWPALAYERELGLAHWEADAPTIRGIHLTFSPKVGNRLLTMAGEGRRTIARAARRSTCGCRAIAG